MSENKNSKDITIENSAFSLTIHWNPEVVLTQLCVFAACLLAIYLVPVPELKTLAKVLLIVDVASVLIGTFSTKKKDGESSAEKNSAEPEEKKESTPPSNKDVVEVKSNKSSSHSSVKIEPDKEIKNKLSIAAPKPKPATPSAPPQQQVEQAPEPQEQERTELPDEVKEAFSNFFNFDMDDDDF